MKKILILMIFVGFAGGVSFAEIDPVFSGVFAFRMAFLLEGSQSETGAPPPPKGLKNRKSTMKEEVKVQFNAVVDEWTIIDANSQERSVKDGR